MSRERREKKRFQAALRDPLHNYTARNHVDRPCSFSFDFKRGDKEKFFKNGGEPIEFKPRRVEEQAGGANPVVPGS